MSAARLSIPAGLLVGIVVAALVLGGIVVLVPEPVPTATPAPSVVAATPSPSIVAPSFGAPSASPSGSIGPGSSASGAFQVGGIGPDIMAAGLRSIMPGVDVQS